MSRKGKSTKTKSRSVFARGGGLDQEGQVGVTANGYRLLGVMEMF